MPFRSAAQRRYMYSRHPDIAARWAKHKFGTMVSGPVTPEYYLSVHQLDVWGNARDGYDVNDVYPSSGTVGVSLSMKDSQLIRHLQNEGYLTRGVKYQLYGEAGYDLYVTRVSDNKPILELRARQ